MSIVQLVTRCGSLNDFPLCHASQLESLTISVMKFVTKDLGLLELKNLLDFLPI